MNKFSKDLVKSMGEACEQAEGKWSEVRVQVVEVPDCAIRRKLGKSQTEFAEKYRIPLPILKKWGQGRDQTDAPASAYLPCDRPPPREISEALKL